MTTHIVVSERDADLIALVLKAQVQQGKLSVEVKPYVENRRRRQENLYRAWCRAVAKETGNDPEMIHKYFASKFLGREHTTVRFAWQGRTIEKEVDDIKSTAKLNVKEMTAYMTDVETFVASTLGIKLPREE